MCEELAHGLRDRLRGHTQEDEVGPAQVVLLGAQRVDPQVARQLDAGEVALVVARAYELLACSGVRVSSVVRRPARSSRRATAVPNEPAPTTVTRRGCWPGGRMAARYPLAAEALARPVACRA